MNKYLKMYLNFYSFITMIASLLFISQLFDKIGLPGVFNCIYMFVHIGSFAFMMAYADKL